MAGHQLSGADLLGDVLQHAAHRLLVAAVHRGRVFLATVDADHRVHGQRRPHGECHAAHGIGKAFAFALLETPVAHIGQFLRHHITADVRQHLIDTQADRIPVGALLDHFSHLAHQYRGAGKQGFTVDHPHRERAGHAGVGAHFLILLENRERRLGGVIKNQATLAGYGNAEHQVIIDDQLLQKHRLNLIHGIRNGFRMDPFRIQLFLVKPPRGLLVALVDQQLIAQANGDGKNLYIIFFEIGFR